MYKQKCLELTSFRGINFSIDLNYKHCVANYSRENVLPGVSFIFATGAALAKLCALLSASDLT